MILDNNAMYAKYKDIIPEDNFEDVGISLTVGKVKEFVYKKTDYVCGNDEVSEVCTRELTPETDNNGKKFFILQPSLQYIVVVKEHLPVVDGIVRIINPLNDISKVGLNVIPQVTDSSIDTPVEVIVENKTPAPIFLEVGSRFCKLVETQTEEPISNIVFLIGGEDNLPLEGATVMLKNTVTEKEYLSTESDAYGLAKINGIVYGDYKMTIHHGEEEYDNGVITVAEPLMTTIYIPNIMMIDNNEMIE